MKKKIFFSYAWRDENINESFLVALRKWITNQGYDCYIDLLDNNYDETAFQKQLMSVLKTCDIFFRIDPNGPKRNLKKRKLIKFKL